MESRERKVSSPCNQKMRLAPQAGRLPLCACENIVDENVEALRQHEQQDSYALLNEDEVPFRFFCCCRGAPPIAKLRVCLGR
jgi:hypothetical protein